MSVFVRLERVRDYQRRGVKAIARVIRLRREIIKDNPRVLSELIACIIGVNARYYPGYAQHYQR